MLRSPLRSRFRPFRRSLTLVLLVGLIAGCGGQRAMIDHPADSTVAATTVTPGGLPEGVTLGERLGQLDAMMRAAPPDSLPILEAEYASLLKARTGEPGVVHTGAPTEQQPTAQLDTIGVEMIPIDTLDGDLEIDVEVEAEPRRFDELADETRQESITTGDPRTFRGLRPSELATIPGYAPTAAERRAASAPTAGRKRQSTAVRGSARATERASSARRAQSSRERASSVSAARSETRAQRAAATSSPQRSAETINSRGDRKGLVEGIAAARSGRYSEAVTKLEPTVKSGRGGAEANYYYALALEKTGRIDQAASQYLRASRGGGALAQRSYLEYCRLLARGGDRRRARELITQFLRRNPDSSQAVAARRLLQTL